MYIHSVYKESPRHYLSIEIKDHKFWKFKTHLYNHHSSKPGHITACPSHNFPELDTIQGITRLPTHKLEELQSLVTTWVGRKSHLKQDLESLVGKLQHACKAFKPCWTFLRRMFELLQGVSNKHHHICLNHAFHSDLKWWHTFLESWNGKAMVYGQDQRTPAVEIYTDAAGEVGCGAWWGVHWLQLKWAREATWRGISITQKEVLPAVLACAVWGHQWKAQRV